MMEADLFTLMLAGVVSTFLGGLLLVSVLWFLRCLIERDKELGNGLEGMPMPQLLAGLIPLLIVLGLLVLVIGPP